MAIYKDVEPLEVVSYQGENEDFDRGVTFILEKLDELPTADVVEVVRCRDCKYQDDCTGQMVHTTRDYVLELNVSTYNKVDYCSYGERK